uniref:SWIM-type domain-containing protein n=1 Tax=Phaseolus vulgaris TaxID=3885 RepID=V7CIA7_PHAVU|nr:hypothetical protein PHAVU_002G110700g [Phaseolus vulgaris]ESW29932.1 hypothetical protein PHAVU_002G110700g [Phaseolus vulgaris]
MDSWYSGGSSSNTKKEPIIRDMVHEFSEDDEQEEYITEEQTFPTSSNDNVQSFSRTTHNIHFDLSKGTSFKSKDVPGTVVQYITRPYVVDGVQDESNYILERVFWSFKPCIEGFKYCKPIVQVDGQFLTGKYHDTLLTAIGQDGNQNIFPLAFAIVEGETKEVLIWFFQLLQAYVTPQSNLCMTTDRGTTILSTLQSPKVVSEEDGLTLVYCIRHITSNFNKRFKNVDLKRKLINMGYEMKQLTLQAKLSAMQAEFPQAGPDPYRFVHQLRVEQATKIQCMLRVEHKFPEDIVALPRKNEAQSAMCHVQRYDRENSIFDVEDMLTIEHRLYPMTYTVKLNEWWCDCGEFQAIHLPCPHVIIVCSFCHLQVTTFVAPIYRLHNILKAYEVQFNPV